MNKITNKITQGVYVLTTKEGGCIVDAVSQISSEEEPLISVAVQKSNFTNELVHKENKVILSIIGREVSDNIIDVFGLHSMRDYNKFDFVDTFEINGVKVPTDIIGYISLEIEDRIENETHTLLICRYKSGEVLNDKEVLTYKYYQEHKDKYIKVKTENNKTAWVCTVCGYVYYGEELPEDFKCPICGVDASLFERQI